MEFEKLLSSELGNTAFTAENIKPPSRTPDFSRAKRIDIGRDLYMEAQSRNMTLSELLELPEYDASPTGSPIDAFERQLALKGVRVNGHNAATVEMFYRGAPALLPEFILREIRRGMAMRPELGRL